MGYMPESTERVISEDEREELKALLTDPERRTAPAGRTPKYLLSGIARCGRCGGVMVRAVGRMTVQANGNTKRQPPSYVCSECHRVRRKQADVDALVEGIVVGRLAMPDAVGLFPQGDPAALHEALQAVRTVDSRLANAADLYASGAIDGAQLSRISEGLRAARIQAQAEVTAALPSAVPPELLGGLAAEVWPTLPMDTKRPILDTLVSVTIMPSGSGKSFNPDSVVVAWRS